MDSQKVGLEIECMSSRRMDDKEKYQEEQRRKVLSRLGGKVNIVHYESNENEEDFVNLDIDKRSEGINHDFVKAVYHGGGDINMDAYKGVVDTGAPKTVAGKAWLEAFTEDSPGLEVKRYRENETFRFGNGPVYKSSMGYIIPVSIGKLRTELKVSVVEANVPLFLGLDFQQEFGVVIDTGRQTLYIKASGQEFNMSQQGNHWMLPLKQKMTMQSQAEKNVLHVNMDELDGRNLWKHIQKVHKNLCHK